jgi:3-hydroxyisobutyrate dehydrogenase-like beta-hydroxyacid dehydrogenase
MIEKIGILHPGEMGISVAAAAQNGGHGVFWASEGRSPETRARAQDHGLMNTHSLGELCRMCTLIISVCPPHAAEQVAAQVLAHAYKGLYVDANAISPQLALRIGEAMTANGVAFVDGGIIGGPAWEANTTWLYLSGKQAGRVADCFAAGPLQAEVIGEEIGRASAVKMCYAAYTKGTTALLGATLAAAHRLGVREQLENQWRRDDPEFPEQASGRLRRSAAKAWRFAGEMEEIAATFKGAGLPEGFHKAAGEIYRRLAAFKGQPAPSLEAVLKTLEGDPRRKDGTRL